MPGRAYDLIVIPDSFWQRPEVAEALRGRDMGRFFALVQQYTGASQTQIGIAIGWSQGKVSDLQRGVSEVKHLAVFEQITEGLKFPDSARVVLGLAPRQSARQLAGPKPHEPVSAGDNAGSPRRASPAIAELCDALTFYGFDSGRYTSAQSDAIPSLRDLERDLKVTFGAYQQSRFTSAASRIPVLLADAQLAVRECRQVERDRALRALALSYQAAAAVLTKSGDSDLALLASERGLNAAEIAGDPAVRGSLIRSVAFSLLATGRLESAMKLVESGVTALQGEISGNGAALSVYGMLFLAGSMASARFGDGPKTADYLREAGDAARRLGKDANYFWTAFGPTNVAIHRVNTAVELGNINEVLESGLALNTGAVPAERRVRYLLDVAQVYGVTGSRDDALGTMLAAERIAPEQVRQHYLSRKVVMSLIRSTPGKPGIELDKLARRVNAVEVA